MRGWAIAAVLILAGCRSGRVPEPSPIARPDPVQSPNAGSKHARLIELGRRAIQRSPVLTERVDHTSGVRSAVLAENGATLSELRRVAKAEGEFQFRSYAPFGKAPRLSEFAALALLAEWGARAAIAEADWGTAIEDSLTLARIGAFLEGGDTRAAITGLTFLSRAYHLLARVDETAPAKTLAGLDRELDGIESSSPSPSVTLRNDTEQARLVIEHFRTLVRKDKWGEIGRIVQPLALGRLSAFRNLNPDKQDTLLRSLAEEVASHAASLAAEAEKPVAQRGKLPEVNANSAEAFWPHAVQGMEAFVSQRDRVTTEGRLLRLRIWASGIALQQGSVPKSLKNAPEELKLDPYSGRPLLYVPTGREASIYSPGEDMRDDGGSLATDVVLAPGD